MQPERKRQKEVLAIQQKEEEIRQMQSKENNQNTQPKKPCIPFVYFEKQNP